MFGIEADASVILRQQKALEAALTTSPQSERTIRRLIRKAVLEARASVARSIRFQNGDPHGTRQAVRSTVYRKVLGGNLNILSRRTAAAPASGTAASATPRTGRGGNRMPRSARTQQILDYAPADRGFILRFVNSGTRQRFAGFRNSESAAASRYAAARSAWESGQGRTGNRGSIAARDFFARYGEQALEAAASRLAAMIEEEMAASISN